MRWAVSAATAWLMTLMVMPILPRHHRRPARAAPAALPQQPGADGPGDQIRRVGLHEVAGFRDRDQRVVLIDILPVTVQRRRQQELIAETVNGEHGTLHLPD